MCPTYAPFANSATLMDSSTSTNNVTVISNQGGSVSAGASINVGAYTINNSGPYSYTSAQISNMNFSTVTGSPSFILPTSAVLIPRTGQINTTAGYYKVNIGYTAAFGYNNCSDGCTLLNNVIGTANSNGWVDATRVGFPVSGLSANQCGCVKMNNNVVAGVARINPVSLGIKSATCSNSPVYSQ